MIQQGRHEMAAAEFRKALGEAPDDADIHAGLAIALLRSDRWQEACESARTAVAKDPDRAFMHWVMALVWVERGHLKDAEASLRTAIEIDPDDADHHGLMARIYLEMERPEQALDEADAGLSLDATNDLSRTFRARALMALGRNAEAGAVSDTLLAEDPEDAWNHCLRGDQLVSEGRAKEARVHYLEALRLDPRMESARYGFALSLKSRNPLYAAMLRILVAFDKLKAWALWGALILVLVAMRFGDAWALKHPGWMPAYRAAKGLFWAVVIMLAVANPLFDIALRFDREGRRALSEDELKATNWHLACFGCAALCAAWALWAKSATTPNRIAFGFLYLTHAVGCTFNATAGYVRKRMAFATWIAAGCLVLTPVFFLTGIMRILAVKKLAPGLPFVAVAIWLPVVAISISAFADDLRKWLEKRRPDRSGSDFFQA